MVLCDIELRCPARCRANRDSADSCTAAMFHVKLFGGLIEPGKVTAQPDNYAARLGMRAFGAVDTRALGTWLIRRAPEPTAAYSCAGVVCSRHLCIAGRRPLAIRRDIKCGAWRHAAMSNVVHILHVAALNRGCMRRVTSPNSAHKRCAAMLNAAQTLDAALSARST